MYVCVVCDGESDGVREQAAKAKETLDESEERD